MISHFVYEEPAETYCGDGCGVADLVRRGQERGLIAGPPEPEPDWRAEAQLQRRKMNHPPAVPVDKTGVVATDLLSVKSRWVDITPAKATEWLKNNFNNRPVSDDVVQAYARDMLAGLWIPTHQGLAFNNKDELIDGQHRLLAVVLSGKMVRMMVTFGLPSVIKGKEMTAMDAVDRGRTRSVADQLKIQHGFKDGSITAALCAALATLAHGERTRRLSVGQTLEIFRAYEEPALWVIANRARNPGLRITGVLAGFVFALVTEEGFSYRLAQRQAGASNESKIARMFTRLTVGEEMTERSPITLLRAFLLSDSAKLLSRGTNRGLAELVLQAIYLERNGAKVDSLEMSLDGLNCYRGLQKQRVTRIGEIFKLPKVEGKK